MTRTACCALLLGLCLAVSPGCSSSSPAPDSFAVMGSGDTVVVQGERGSVNLALVEAAYTVGDAEVLDVGKRRLPSYEERSEFRSVERDGIREIFEQRTIRFDLPEGGSLKAVATYTDGATSVRVTTAPESPASERAFVIELTRVLRERGAIETP